MIEVINYKVVHKSTLMDSILPSDITKLIGTFVGVPEFYEDCFESVEDWSKQYWSPADYYGGEETMEYELDAIEVQYGEPDYYIDVCNDVPINNEYERDDFYNYFEEEEEEDADEDLDDFNKYLDMRNDF